MIRVLEVFGEPISRGGQESYVMSAITNMNTQGIYFDLLTPYYCDNKKYKEAIHNMGGEVYQLNLNFKPGKSRKFIEKHIYMFVKEREYDVVHIHSGSISVLAYFSRAVKKAGIKKVIVHSHSSGVCENIKHRILKMYASMIMKKNVDVFCACSEEASKWKYSEKIINKEVHILKNGVDERKYAYNKEIRDKIRTKLGIKENEYVIGHVGRFTYEKNQIFLVDLMEKLEKKDCKLVLVGSGDCYENVYTSVKNKNLLENIILLGVSDNVDEIIQAFDLFVLPSLYEGLGIVAIEAQASGLPIIASCGVPKMIKLSNNVSFVSLDDMEKWKKEILVYSRKQIDRSLGKMLIKENGYSISETSEELRTLYTGQ